MYERRQTDDSVNEGAADEVRMVMAGAPDGGCTGCLLIASKYAATAVFGVGVLFRLDGCLFVGGGVLVLLDALFIWITIEKKAGLLPSGAWLHLAAWIIGCLMVTPWYTGFVWGSGVVGVLTAMSGGRILRRL